MRYPDDVAPFGWLAPDASASDWADIAALSAPTGEVSLVDPPSDPPPAGWEAMFTLEGVQLVGRALEPEWSEEVVRLGREDVPEMMDLVERTRPGPFRPRTIELGSYLGVRRGGALVAMAGERLRAPGWTEISAVCTDPEFRGQGLAARLVRAVGVGIAARGDTAFLHATSTNVGALRLYGALGFVERRAVTFAGFRSTP
jgi:GNAT superfamily N-acetyltransferase